MRAKRAGSLTDRLSGAAAMISQKHDREGRHRGTPVIETVRRWRIVEVDGAAAAPGARDAKARPAA